MKKLSENEFEKKIEKEANETFKDTLMDEDAKGEENYTYTEIVQNTKEAKLSKLPWLIAIFLILGVSILVGSSFFKNNPKTIYTMAIDNLFNILTSNINDNAYDITEGKINLDYNIESIINKEMYSELSKIKWDIKYKADNASERSHMIIQTKKDNENFVNADIYSDKKGLYINSSEIFDKYIRFENNTNLNLSYASKQTMIILKALNQAIDKTVALEKINGKKIVIDYKDNKLKVYASTLTIDKNREEVVKTFMNTLKSNEDLVSALAQIKNVTKKDIKIALDKYTKIFINKLEDLGKINITLYTNNKTGEFITALVENKYISITLLNNQNNEYILSFDNTKTGIDIKGILDFDVNKEKTKYNFGTNLEVKKNNVKVYSINSNIKITNKEAKTFDKVDVSNYVDKTNLSDIDKFSMYTKVNTNESMSKLFNTLPNKEEIFK